MAKKKVPPKDSYVPEGDKDTEQDSEIAALKARLDAAESKLQGDTEDTSNSTVSGKINQEDATATEYSDETEYIPGESGAGQGSVPTYPGRDSEGPAPELPLEEELPRKK